MRDLLTDEDIVRAVRSIRYGSKQQRQGRFVPSLRGLAKVAGLSRQAVYNVAETGRMGPETKQMLAWALVSTGVVNDRA